MQPEHQKHLRGPSSDTFDLRERRNDLVVPVADGIEFERLIRNAELVVFDRCGHVPMLEHPVRFNRLLDRFLAEDARGAPSNR